MIVVFTNGCFDLLHPGHVDLLRRARALGDRLVVGINSDRSVRAIKGPGRPVQSAPERVAVLSALRSVDQVLVFDEPTPALLIEEIQPDVLVKGGDWPVDQIVGAESVLRRGGRVESLPLLPGHSTSALLDRLRGAHPAENTVPESLTVLAGLRESIAVKQALLTQCGDAIHNSARLLRQALRDGHKILLFGNGGSAADAQHIAAELVGRYRLERRALPALALTTDSSALTAIGNDYGFEGIFARQLDALAQPGDAAVGISTSGNSPNVLSAMMTARSRGCVTVGLTGAAGRRLAGLCDAAVLVPSAVTARIQECHITIGHLWTEAVESVALEMKEMKNLEMNCAVSAR
jgi:D-sedoheptulose 7-phosphate isomerase